MIPLAGHRSLLLYVFRPHPLRPHWLRGGPVALHYGLDGAGHDPFADPDLRRFLLAIGARFRALSRRRADAAAELLLRECGFEPEG